MKTLRRILKITLIATFLLIILGISFTAFFGPQIENIIRENINSQLNNKLYKETEIKFSLLRSFPNASVTLFDVKINNSYEDSTDTLFYAKELIININIIDLLLKDYSFKNIAIKNGNIKIHYNKNGDANFNVLKDIENSNERLEIQNMELINTNISYSDIKNINFLKCSINNIQLTLSSSEIQSAFSIKGNIFANKLTINNVNYISKKNTYLNTEIILESDSIKINAPVIMINQVNFRDLKYTYFKHEYLLSFITENEKIEEILIIIPSKFQYLFKDHKLNGQINSLVKIEKKKENIDASCEIEFKLNNCDYESLTIPFHISQINSRGHFSNGESHSLSTSKIILKDFKSNKKEGVFNGDFIITNFNQYHLIADLYSSWKLKELEVFIDDSPFKNLEGSVDGNIHYNGNLSFDKKMKGYISSSTHDADWNFNDVSFNYKESPLNFIFPKSRWEIKNNLVKIENDKFQISESDLSFTGEIDDLLLYLIEEKKKITIQGRISSESTKFKELFTVKDINEDSNEDSEFISVLPDWLDVNIEFHIHKFNYEDFNSTEFGGELEYNSNTLKLNANKLEMNSLNGKISGNVMYYENKIHDLVLKANIALDKINISKGFRSLNNFGQNFITNNNIDGKGTSNIYIQSMWDKDYNFFSKSLHVNADLKIENGELIDFKPMYNLSNYVSLNELKNIKFATLENKIRIEKGKVIIPAMDIHSTAFSVHVSGTHKFNNKINYKIRLLLSDILSKKMKKESKKIDLKDLENDHSGKTTVQLRMRGTVDNPKIYLDKVKLKSDIVSEIIKETEEIKDIIKEEIFDNTDTTDAEKNLDSGIEIEWEDENQ